MINLESYYDQVNELSQEIRQAYDELNKLQSALDRQVSSIYHEIEKSDFDVEEGFTYSKRLKETLQHRRVVKDEIARLLPLYLTFKESVPKIEEQYNRALRKSYEIKRSLNTTMSIDDVFEKLQIKTRLAES